MANNHRDLDSTLHELLQRVASLEAKVKDVDARLTSVEDKIDKIVEMLIAQKNGMIRFIVGTFVTIIIIILSFIATLFGLGWKPPTLSP